MDDSLLASLKAHGAPARLTMEVIRRAGHWKGETAECIERRLAFIIALLAENRMDLASLIPPSFNDDILELARGRPQHTVGVRLPSGMESEAGTLSSHLTALGRAAMALQEADFSATVMRKVKALDLTYTDISVQAGLAPTFVKTDRC